MGSSYNSFLIVYWQLQVFHTEYMLAKSHSYDRPIRPMINEFTYIVQYPYSLYKYAYSMFANQKSSVWNLCDIYHLWQKKKWIEFAFQNFSNWLKNNYTELLITIDGATVAFEIKSLSNLRNQYKIAIGS